MQADRTHPSQSLPYPNTAIKIASHWIANFSACARLPSTTWSDGPSLWSCPMAAPYFHTSGFGCNPVLGSFGHDADRQRTSLSIKVLLEEPVTELVRVDRYSQLHCGMEQCYQCILALVDLFIFDIQPNNDVAK